MYMCTVLLPPGVNPIAVKYIISPVNVYSLVQEMCCGKIPY